MRSMVALVMTFAVGVAAASDPGGYPGLLVAKFNTSYDTTSDIRANAYGRVYECEEMYAASLSSYTTYGWAGYMWMEGGVTYNFKGCYDDFTTVKVNDDWVYTRGSDCTERQGSYTPMQSGWYPVEFRVGNNGGAGGCQKSSQYGILWNTSLDETWRKVCPVTSNGIVFKTGETNVKHVTTSAIPYIISSSIRSDDPTILDTRFIVLSDKPTANVRALAFEDGERSFYKVIRPETFIEGTEENIGDNIAANVEHTISWKVSADWKTDLANVKFEILTSDIAQLPLKIQKIPAIGPYPSLTVAYNEQTDSDIFNALLWWYADGDPTIAIENGYLDIDGVRWINRTAINHDARMPILKWLYDKMGWEATMGGNLISYARRALRKELWFNTSRQNCYIEKATKPDAVYVGEKAFMTIDLADRFQVSYLDQEPLCGWGEEYKTTKLLLRKIDGAKFMMQNNKDVTLTKPYYIGVFEVTQKQYELVMGLNPSVYKGDLRPVEYVSYSAIQNFWKTLNDKTGLWFDFPTEAQWEYACRAGTSSHFNNGGDGIRGLNLDLRAIGRYATNKSDGRGGCAQHTIVGSYEPNAWGLYDMHGNVAEWCRDWYSDWNSDSEVDYSGPDSGIERIVHGGSWAWCNVDDDGKAYYSAPLGAYNSTFFRHSRGPTSVSSEIGFRACLQCQ